MAKNVFNTIKVQNPKSNVFDLSHDVKLSCNMGHLIPTMYLDCLPGDKVNIGCNSLLRFAPMLAPLMHRVNVTMHYWFVPYRLLWPNWEKFITQTKVNDVVPAFPFIDLADGSYVANGLMDYFGLPDPGALGSEPVSAMPFAAYQFIYNERYRDQNLIPEVNFALVDGDNNANDDLLVLRRRAWMHDYFTGCLPFAQKGDAVDIPLGDVTLKDTWAAGTSAATPNFISGVDGSVDVGALQQSLTGGSHLEIVGSADKQAYDPDGTLEVQPTTINTLRRAFSLQRFLEKLARGGSRYVENILINWGVKSPDARLQQPEYITGTISPVQISEVLNTTGDTGAAEPLPQGNMAGHGVSVTNGKYGGYFCQEHGCIIGIMSVMPVTAYQQGIHKSFQKFDPLEYGWPDFAHIGEQEVKVRELFAFGANGAETFGYVPRFAEYRYMPSRVAGDFRTSLNYWHLGRIFAAEPALNQAFIECDPSTRIFAVDTGNEQHLWTHIYHSIKAVRKLPKFGTPI